MQVRELLLSADVNAFGYWRRGCYIAGWIIHLAIFDRHELGALEERIA